MSDNDCHEYKSMSQSKYLILKSCILLVPCTLVYYFTKVVSSHARLIAKRLHARGFEGRVGLTDFNSISFVKFHDNLCL